VRGKPWLLLPVLVVLATAMVAASAVPMADASTQVRIWTTLPYRAEPGVRQVKVWTILYRAHNGKPRKAYVSLPAWYGKREHPRIPLVISPHGRGVSARANAALWGALPARGMFAVISPEGAGRVLSRYSWGSVGQISDLAKMPEIARRTLPWLRIDARRVYAMGGSMGGQETLLLLGRYPELLAGAAAFDSVADLARQYRSFPEIPCDRFCRSTWHGPVGKSLQSLARREMGGTPRSRPGAYAVRSPLTYARTIAASCVPLQLWWSVSDRIVANQGQQSGALFQRVKKLNPKAPVQAYVGFWVHSREMQAKTRLPLALAAFGLLQEHPRRLLNGIHVVPEPEAAPRCGIPGAAKRRAAERQPVATAQPTSKATGSTAKASR
jgi:poly(3-hydroxybutyrate) depolymerase